ncbi:hypothetical protein [Bacteroides ihuae]|uniref:hypothetical protein n=1 Tax=Bacteroides ihuae TaxID=1852362 RepID=UPI0008D9AF50|nr:hypothetical protein [Bacteroides ihuae]
MGNRINIEEMRVLLKEMLTELHLSNKIMAEELARSERVEKALNLLMIFENASISTQIISNNEIKK